MPRHPSLIRPPLGFAHRGARVLERENTLAAFRRAVELGATGLESDVWLTADGVPVLDHDGVVRRGLRRRRIRDLRHDELPDHIPTLGGLYEACGTRLPLSLDVKDPAAAPVVVEASREAGGGALAQLWLCHPDWRVVAGWRDLSDLVRLVDSTRLRAMSEGPERRAARLAEAGIDAVNLRYPDWTGGLVTLFHRFDRFALGWDCQHERVIDELLAMGIDGIYSDHPDRLATSLARHPAS
ncbi:MAG: glycerophosphodiester phosphodiesterase [Acidimicrobiia bacterium]|nr:glycerophosphodiester phosphodiesterase [Acidimicrobiia bacterium]